MSLPAAAGLRAPGVLVQVVDPPPAVEPVRVDVPAFVCVCERGPVDEARRVGSWAQFGQVFGGFMPNGLGAYTIKAFFDQGGDVCWVVRVVAPEVTTASAGPQPPDRTTAAVSSVAGIVAGAAATVRQLDETHTYLVVAVDPAAATLTWDRPLHPALDTTQPFTVSSGAGRAGARLRGAGGAPSLDVEAASPGVWGNHLDVVATPGRRTATASRVDQHGGPLATPVESSAGFLVGDLVRVSQETGGVVTSGDAVVERVDQAERVVWWQSPLPAALDLSAPFALESESTSLTVLEHGSVVESWPDLSMRPEHPRFAETVLAASSRVRVLAVGAAAPTPSRVPLRGGRDGTAALSLADLLGDELLADGRGVAALAGVDEPAVLAVPDLVGTWTPPTVLDPVPVDPCDPCADRESAPAPLDAVVVDAGARFDPEDVVRAQSLLVEGCERSAERVVLLDPPCAGGSPTTWELRSWAARFASSYAVAVVPWLTVLDPRSAGGVRRVPASGHLAGMIAQTDAVSGPWLNPANRTLAWAHGVDVPYTDEDHALANALGMLVVRALPGRGLVPMGGRTLSSDPLWVFLSVRRTMLFLRRTLRVHLAWTVFEPNDTMLARTMESAVSTLMEQVWEAGALVGSRAEAAYALQVEQDRAAAGELVLVLGVALARPAEFVVLRVSRTDNRLELVEMPERVQAAGVAS